MFLEDNLCSGTENVRRRTNRGVYFLANDCVYDLAVAFLNSFRLSNPATALCLIPYASDVERLSQLASLYNFSIFGDHEALRKCDELSHSFFDSGCGHFRKLCAFSGVFDEFIYIDVDTIVLRDLSFTFDYLQRYDIVFSHSNIPSIRKWVWKETIYANGALSNDQISFSASTGFFCSRRGALDVEQAMNRLPGDAPLKNQMELLCAEQPYLNLLVVTSSLRYTSLYKIKRDNKQLNIPLEVWAGRRALRLRKDPVEAYGESILLLHWAGIWAASARDRAIYRYLARWGIRSRTPSVAIFMPRKHIWKRYRHLFYSGWS